MPNNHRFHSLTIDPDVFGVSPAVHLPDVSSSSHPSNWAIEQEMSAQSNSPAYTSVNSVDPNPTWTTWALEAILDILGAVGITVESATNTGLTSNLQLLNDSGFPVGGATNRGINYFQGILRPTTLNVENRGNASLTFTHNEIGLPPAPSLTLTLPTITIAPARWTLGPIDIGGVTLNNYTSLTIDFGNNVTVDSVESTIGNTHASENSHSPSITIGGIDPTWWDILGSTGLKSLAHVDTILFLRKRSQDETFFVPDITAEHIKFTLAGLGSVDEAASSTAVQISETELRLTGKTDTLGNSPLLITTKSAIT